MKRICLWIALVLAVCLPLAGHTQEGATLSEDVYAFQLLLEGTLFEMPTDFAHFEAAGWKFKDGEEPDAMLPASTYASVTLVYGRLDDQAEIKVDFLNLGINAKPIMECPIFRVTVEQDLGMKMSRTRMAAVELPKGVIGGKTTKDEVEAAYGTPSGRGGISMYDDTYTYQRGSQYDCVALGFNKDVLEQVIVSHVPDGPGEEEAEISQEIPDYIQQYVAPTELGEDLSNLVVEFEGDLYRMPAPISAFEANGWVVTGTRGEYLAAGDHDGCITMDRDGKSAIFDVVNFSGLAVPQTNTVVYALPPELGKDRDLSLTMPGGIKIGSTKEELFSIHGKKLEVSIDMETYTRYNYLDQQTYSVTFNFTIDKETNLVSDVECRVRTR